MQKGELEAGSGKLTLLVHHMMLAHELPGLLLAFKEVALTREYKPAFPMKDGSFVLHSLPLHQESFM